MSSEPTLGKSRRPEGRAQDSSHPRFLVAEDFGSSYPWPRQYNLGLISWYWTHIYRSQRGLELGLKHPLSFLCLISVWQWKEGHRMLRAEIFDSFPEGFSSFVLLLEQISRQ